MLNNQIVLSVYLFIIAQVMVWIQLNGQFVWPSIRRYEWFLIVMGMPITYLFLEATRNGVSGFGGLLWPQRFIAFACGILIFAFFTWWLKGEPITFKTLISLLLSFSLVGIQVFWR